MINKFKEALNNTIHKPEDGLVYWREKIFLNMLLILIGLGFLSYVMAMVIAIKVKLWPVVFIDTMAMAMLIGIYFNRSVKVEYRIHVLIFLTVVLGIAFLFLIGPEGPGLLYLVGFNLLTSILLGLRATYYSLGTTVVLIIVLAVGMQFDVYELSAISEYGTLSFLASSINVLLISSICSIPLAILVQRLEKNIKYQNGLRLRLQQNLIALAEAKDKAEESDRLKSSFLANMSHEIRTPLNAILGFSQLIKEQPELEPKERIEFVNTINDSGEYLLNIIENILDISMIEANQLKYFKHEVELDSIFKELSIMYDPRIKNTNGVEIIIDDKGLDDNITIFTDGQRLKQIFVNLINNALKNTDHGYVKIGLMEHSGSIEFYVSDTGRGIEKENQARIFKRFVKIQEAPDENVGGTGLGLPITKGILDILGGKIRLESEINKGTTFYFSIPKQN